MRKAKLLARRNLTRDERKKQILLVFDMERRGARFDGITAQKVANEIELLATDYVRDMLNELVEEGELTKTVGVHRVLKNGVTIEKVYYWRIPRENEPQELSLKQGTFKW